MITPSSALLEFLTWFVWLACFASIQSRLCEHYPAMRGLCRKAYLFTMVVPIGCSIALMVHADSGTDMFALLNRAFGAGVFVQTFMRAVVLLEALAWKGFVCRDGIAYDRSLTLLFTGGNLLALAGLASHAMRKSAASRMSVLKSSGNKSAG